MQGHREFESLSVRYTFKNRLLGRLYMKRKSFLSGSYAFRAARHEDLPLLRRWLETPEVTLWWGDPEEQASLLASDLDDPHMAMWIVEFEGRPFAYVQDYDVHNWPQHHFAHLPPGSRGVDAFIGEPDMLGIGHGSVFLRRFAEWLRASGVPVVAIDPDPKNLRARYAYTQAGFVGEVEVDTEWGPAVLMTFAPEFISPCVQ
jgi:aminoglycoside 6'-N-acetyltransferase